jgi:hypothetical protein
MVWMLVMHHASGLIMLSLLKQVPRHKLKYYVALQLYFMAVVLLAV